MTGKKHFVFLLIAFFLSCSNVIAQSYLLLYKKGTSRRFKFEVSDELTFKKAGQKKFITAKIIGFTDSTIVFDGFELRPGQIDIIKPAEGDLAEEIGRKLPLAGLGFIIIDYFQGENTNSFNKSSLIIGATLAGAGVLIGSLNKKKYIINLKWKLLIMN